MLGTWFVEPVLVNFVSVILVSIRFGVLTSSGSASRCDGADRSLSVWLVVRTNIELRMSNPVLGASLVRIGALAFADALVALDRRRRCVVVIGPGDSDGDSDEDKPNDE